MKSSNAVLYIGIVLFAFAVVSALALSQNKPVKPSKSGKEFKEPVNFNEKKYRDKEIMKERERQKWERFHAREQDWGDMSDPDMVQHPIDEPPRKKNRDLGEMCTYSADCHSGCCLMDRESKIRSCQPKSLLGEKCSSAQVKADLYVDACPCEAGIDFCAYPGEYCTK